MGNGCSGGDVGGLLGFLPAAAGWGACSSRVRGEFAHELCPTGPMLCASTMVPLLCRVQTGTRGHGLLLLPAVRRGASCRPLTDRALWGRMAVENEWQ